MILAAIIMAVLALVLLVYILEPVLSAEDDHVEIDAAVNAPAIPDFRALLAESEDTTGPVSAESGTQESVSQPEPAEHRSS